MSESWEGLLEGAAKALVGHLTLDRVTANKNGEEITKKFDKEVPLPGKKLLQLWNEKIGHEMIAHNIYSGWYVLVEEDPKVSLDKNGCVVFFGNFVCELCKFKGFRRIRRLKHRELCGDSIVT